MPFRWRAGTSGAASTATGEEDELPRRHPALEVAVRSLLLRHMRLLGEDGANGELEGPSIMQREASSVRKVPPARPSPPLAAV